MVLPPPARGAGTLIPSAQRLVWAAKQPLGMLWATKAHEPQLNLSATTREPMHSTEPVLRNKRSNKAGHN